MDPEQLRARIRERIRNGVIPAGPGGRTYGGKGTNSTCSCCNTLIGPDEIEYEVHFDGPPTPLRAHLNCYWIWWTEREFTEAAGSISRPPPGHPGCQYN
jgi:hypothetical protein